MTLYLEIHVKTLRFESSINHVKVKMKKNSPPGRDHRFPVLFPLWSGYESPESPQKTQH